MKSASVVRVIFVAVVFGLIAFYYVISHFFLFEPGKSHGRVRIKMEWPCSPLPSRLSC